MGDKDTPNIFNGKQKVLIYPANSDPATATPLDGVVADSTSILSEEKSSEEEPWKPKPLSFTVTVEDAEALKKLAFMHPDVQKIMQRAQNMLDHIKDQLDLFYRLKQPLNRKERRERARELKGKIQRFNAYCKEHGIEIKNNPE